MELRQLRYFVAVAEELHFRRAAARLHMSQPPLSQQIQQLEAEMGCTLLARTRRRVELTPAGAAFLRDARALLSELDGAVETARRIDAGQTGRIRINFVGSALVSTLPDLVQRFRAAHPRVEVELHERSTIEQLRAIKAGSVDVGLIRAPLEADPELAVEIVARERTVAAIAAKHPLAAMRRVPLRRLAAEPLVLFPRDQAPGFHDLLDLEPRRQRLHAAGRPIRAGDADDHRTRRCGDRLLARARVGRAARTRRRRLPAGDRRTGDGARRRETSGRWLAVGAGVLRAGAGAPGGRSRGRVSGQLDAAVGPSTANMAVQRTTGLRERLDCKLSVEEAVLRLRGDRRPFALVGEWFGGLCILGSEPVRVAACEEDPFEVVQEVPDVVGAGDVAVGGGWVGWLGYGLGGRIEELPPAPPAPVPCEPFSLAFYDHVIVFDGARWWFEALWSETREAALRERLSLWRSRLGDSDRPLGPRGTGHTSGARSRKAVSLTPFRFAANGARGHLDAVGECTRRITTGELFQANLCVRLESSLVGDPLDLFATALAPAPPRFAAFVDGALSLSPERFLRRRERTVWSEPIKGTRPRAPGESAGSAAYDELVASAKDAAEHVMIVDLMRNDLGRVCDYGSIVASEPAVQPHAGVWHLVSTVRGTLRDEVGDGELLRAAFPPGSVTGAPKVQAMKVISELEATRRERYTGAIGIISPLAGLDLNVAIRTFEVRGERLWLGVGGGIVADSKPGLELEEALAKAVGPVAAIGGTVAAGGEPVEALGEPVEVVGEPVEAVSGTVAAVAASSPGLHGAGGSPRALVHGHRPDPAGGVFETILVEDGEPVLLDEHLSRLLTSLRDLYGVGCDQTVLAAAARAACADAGPGRSRLRVLADPDGSVRCTTESTGAPPKAPIPLAPFLLPGGLGAHKWRDRSLVNALMSAAPGAAPLILDTDGCVLEAAGANVWIREGDALLTPPADGRLLAGVTRSLLLGANPGTREQAFDLARLARADGVFLTSSISGRRAAVLA